MVVSAANWNWRSQQLTQKDGLPSNVVGAMLQDAEGYVWMATANGLCRYDGYTIRSFTQTTALYRPNMLNHLVEDRQHHLLWVYSASGQVACMDLKKLDFIDYKQQKLAVPPQPKGTSVPGDDLGGWLVTRADGSQRLIPLIRPDIVAYTHNEHFQTIRLDSATTAISTYGGGLYIYNNVEDRLWHYSLSDRRPVISTDFLTGMMLDDTGCLWVAQDYLGVCILRPDKLQYQRLKMDDDDSMPDCNNVRSMFEDGDGRLMIGMNNGDLYAYDLANATKERITTHGHRIYVAYRDAASRQMWIGTRGKGLWINGEHVEGMPSEDIYAITADAAGSKWVGTLGGGVVVMRPDGSRTTLLKGEKVHALALDRKERMWVATESGLYRIAGNGHVREVLAGKRVITLTVDADGHLWAGTAGDGLVVVDTGKETMMTQITRLNGLNNNTINAVLAVNRQVWATTEEGLACVDIDRTDILNYDITASSLGNVFNENAMIRLRDGRIAFGSHNGLVIIAPDGISVEQRKDNVRLTALYVNGIDHSSALTASQLALNHEQNSLRVSFSSLDYAHIGFTLYSYRMDGTDDDWCEATTRNEAVYNELPPGDYTFRVRCQAGMGEWGPEQVLTVSIAEPWWNTWWFRLSVLLLVLMVSLGILLLYRRIFRLHDRLEVEQQVSAYRTGFYDRIIQELRTPLTIIQGESENVHTSNTSKTTMRNIRQSSNRVMRLAGMMLQFHKINDMETQLKLLQQQGEEDTERQLHEIVTALHTNETEMREMAPLALNDGLIVIVSEDVDEQRFLENLLNTYFPVTVMAWADDVLLLADRIVKQAPTLVVVSTTDDSRGLSLIVTLRQTIATPIVHISSSDDDSLELKSLKAGTDEFVRKPFNGKVLVEKVVRIHALQKQSKTGNAPTRQTEEEPVAILTSVKDRRFLNTFETILRQSVQDQGFTVEAFAAKMGLGKTQFYKKTKQLTGQLPAEHLRQAKLDYAATLLRDSNLTIEEVCTRCGFSNTPHFYQLFKARFGQTPSHYRKSSLSADSTLGGSHP